MIEPSTPLVPGWHLDAICQHLEAVSDGRIRNLIITVPPRSSKSSVVAVLWPAWVWIRHPETRWLFASYASALATRDSVRCRRVIASPWYQERWGGRFRLAGDVNLKTRFENDRSGHRIALGVGSGVTGEGGDITVVDDPHNVADAESIAVRQSTKDWYDLAYYNRVNNPQTGRRVVVGQRVHHEDLIGHLLASGDWEELCLPEEYDPARRCRTSIGFEDPRKRQGDLLRRGRFDAEQVAEAKKRLGSRGYAAQHQQQPVPAGGLLFKREWFRRWRDAGSAYRLQDRPGVVNVQECSRYLVCDPAGGTSASADHTAVGIIDRTPQNDLLVVHVLHERIAVERIVPTLKGLAREWGCEWCVVEGGFLQEALVRQARAVAGMPPVQGVTTAGKSKLARALPAIVKAEAGQIYLPDPDEYDWVQPFLDEVCRFSGDEDAEDDQVDMLAYAVSAEDQVAGDGEVYVLGERRRT